MLDWPFIASGALVGLAVGLTGVGGGALMTPILLIFFGISPSTAIATDLWFAAITKIAGVAIHQRAKMVDWQVVRRLWWGSIVTASLVVGLIAFGHQPYKLNFLNKIIGYLIIVTAIGLILAPNLLRMGRNWRLSDEANFKHFQPILTVIMGAVLGLIVSTTSVGAGALGSVVLLYLYPLRMTPHRLVATDVAHAIPLAIVAGIGYLFAGLVDWWMLMNLLLGSIPTVIIGSTFAKKLPGRAIQVLIALILLAAGAKLIF